MFVSQMVFNRIRRAWLSSALMLAQFAIGFTLLCSCISIVLSINHATLRIKSETGNMLRLTWHGNDSIDAVSYLPRADQLSLQKQLEGSADMLVTYQATFPVFNKANEKLSFEYLLFFNYDAEPLFDDFNVLDEESKLNIRDFSDSKNAAVFLPEVALEVLHKGLQSGKLKVTPFEGIARNIVSSYFEIESPPTKVYFMPTDMPSLCDSLPKDSSIQCFLVPKRNNRVPIQDISRFLSGRHPIGVQYYIYDMLHPISNDIERAQLNTRSLLIMTLVIILAVCTGFAGLILLNAQKRKREICILLCIGIPKRVLYFEMLLESLIIVITGALIGIALSYRVVRFMATPALPLSIQPVGIVSPMTLALLEGVALTWLQIKQVHSENIATELKEIS